MVQCHISVSKYLKTTSHFAFKFLPKINWKGLPATQLMPRLCVPWHVSVRHLVRSDADPLRGKSRNSLAQEKWSRRPQSSVTTSMSSHEITRQVQVPLAPSPGRSSLGTESIHEPASMKPAASFCPSELLLLLRWAGGLVCRTDPHGKSALI